MICCIVNNFSFSALFLSVNAELLVLTFMDLHIAYVCFGSLAKTNGRVAFSILTCSFCKLAD